MHPHMSRPRAHGLTFQVYVHFFKQWLLVCNHILKVASVHKMNMSTLPVSRLRFDPRACVMHKFPAKEVNGPVVIHPPPPTTSPGKKQRS